MTTRQTEDPQTPVNAALLRHAVHLETASMIGQRLTSLISMSDLLYQVVLMVQAGFGYRFAGVWLVNERHDAVALQAAAGLADDDWHTPGERIALDASNVVAEVCRSGSQRWLAAPCRRDTVAGQDSMPTTCVAAIVPLRVGDMILGALDIQNDWIGTYTPEERLVAQTLASQIAIAIRNAHLHEVEQRRRRLAESLEQIGRELSSSLDLAEVPGRILDHLAAVVPYERCSVILRQGELLRIVAQRGFGEDARARNMLIMIREDDIFLALARTRRPSWIDDVTQVPGWQPPDWLPLNRSWLGAPLIVKDETIGMISMTRRPAAAFTEDDALLASAFAGQAAVALHNANLYGELDRAYHVLEKLDRTKSSFIEVAAHELRTPLAIIKGYAQILATHPGMQSSADARMLLDGVVNGVGRLHEIVNSMLDVSRIDSQTLSVKAESMQIGTLIGQVRTGLQQALLERQLEFTADGLDVLPRIQADPELLYKLFAQVIGNAIKYTPDGGAIRVTGGLVREGDVPTAVEVVVTDTGIGIDPDQQELIFEKFYQTGEVATHSSGKTKFKGGGPGLGLAIARGIVTAHGGRIWVESEGHDEERCPGSRFHVRLPLVRPG